MPRKVIEALAEGLKKVVGFIAAIALDVFDTYSDVALCVQFKADGDDAWFYISLTSLVLSCFVDLPILLSSAIESALGEEPEWDDWPRIRELRAIRVVVEVLPQASLQTCAPPQPFNSSAFVETSTRLELLVMSIIRAGILAWHTVALSRPRRVTTTPRRPLSVCSTLVSF
jgi:hypothetical protein